MEEAFVAILLGTSGISALVASRIFWLQKPQGAANPYVVLTKISAPRTYTLTEPTKLIGSRIQVDCYGATFSSAKSVARAVEAKLSGLKTTQDNIFLDACFLVSERDTFEDAATPDKLFRTSLDFTIWHKGA